MFTLDAHPGNHISTVCRKAAETSTRTGEQVKFEFNGTTVIASPGETPEILEDRWSREFDAAAKAYRNSDEYKKLEADRAAEQTRLDSIIMTEQAQTESEMRETETPWPRTRKQLDEYVESLVARSHDYGTCVYAMSLAATAAFNYVAHRLGTTGFQSGCAGLDVLKRTRHIDGPFILLKAEDALYPQYDLPGRLQKALDEWKPWLKENAEKKLAESRKASTDVEAHWRKLAQ